MTGQATATLTIDKITTDNGYVEINMGQTEIIQDTKTVIHIINTNELRQTISSIEDNIQRLHVGNDPTIKRELETIYAKITAIEPGKTFRQKRGLVNLIGTVQKWLFGTMDDNDRLEITDHMKIVEENNYNAINNLNKQIEINSHFNETITDLKNIIETDRKQLSQAYEELTANEKRIILQQLKTDQILKLKILEEKLDQILDSIALVKQGLVHPSMLTAVEIRETELDVYKLKNVKVGLLKYDQNRLILALKIPHSYKLVDYKLITAIPTENMMEVIINDQYMVEINGTKYKYDNKIQYKDELEPINNCITKNNCKLKENKVIEIKKLDDSTIICKNMQKVEIVNQCDDRKIKLNGNYLVTINNCTIEILNETFSNNNIEFTDRFFYTEDVTYNFTKQLNFEDIVIKNFANLEHIKLLRFHKNINYIANSTMLIIIVVIIISIIILTKKNKKLKLSIKNCNSEIPKRDKIQENFQFNGGEVTYPIRNTSFSIFSPQ